MRDVVEALEMFAFEAEVGGLNVVFEMCERARTYDCRCDCGLFEYPAQGNLGRAVAKFVGNFE